MTLSVGEKLGPYEIVGLIGKGGMGEVYRAHDTRLGRDVAIKISQEQFTERFAREARAVAALNHPNVCTLYDVGPNYLVMEYVEGEAPKGPLPLDTALLYARQIADALDAAHEKNIVHRDLKPGNIKIRPDGGVKVLDFGLAKIEPASGGDPENSPTLSMAATQLGVILGTAAYMSPEQARGKRVDKRADIWAFGVVFYEMLTGKRLFQGEDATDTLAKVIQAEPKLEGVPASVQRLLKKCLEKDPKNRLRDIGDAWSLLLETPSSPPVRAGGKRLSLVVLAALTLIAAALGFSWWRLSRPVSRPLVRLAVDLGSGVSLPPTPDLPDLALSPDGTRLAYLSGNQAKLNILRLDQPKSRAVEISGIESVRGPFFSPDGQWLGFESNGKLNKISVEGGAIVPLADLKGGFGGASWDPDGNILAGQIDGGLVRIPSGGGAPMAITESESNPIAVHHLPRILPGGKAILFGLDTLDSSGTNGIEVLTLADHKEKTVVRAGSARYLPSGHLIYANKGTLFAVPFDVDRMETRGAAVPILDDVAYSGQSNIADFDVSSAPAGHGTLVYRPGGPLGQAGVLGQSTIQWMDSTGKKTPLIAKAGDYWDVHLSPDGKRVAFTSGNPILGGDVWVYDPSRENYSQLTSGRRYSGLVWTEDGQFLIFGAETGMWWKRADGVGPPQPLMTSKNTQVPNSVSSDGKWLAYTESPPSPLLLPVGQIWYVPLEKQGGLLKPGKAIPFATDQSAATPSFSPDVKWLAYTAYSQIPSAQAPPQVYVRPFPPPPPGQERQSKISSDSGMDPLWSPTRHELVYRSAGGPQSVQISIVSYTVTGDAFEAKKPQPWAVRVPNGPAQLAGLSADGKNALVNLPMDLPKPPAEPPKPDHTVVFLENFFDYLTERVPVGK